MKKNHRKKDRDIFSTVEENRRIDTGMPAGDPNSGTKWTDTLLYIGILIIVFILYVVFFK